jgi:hypothetical protein
MRESDADFYSAAERRIWRLQLAIGGLGVAASWAIGRWPAAAGFAVGAALSSLNFLWIKQAVDAVTDKATGAETAAARRKRRLLVAKFAGRYLLIGLAAYVILRSTSWNVKAFLAGLLLFAAAILAEICLEIFEGLRSDRDGRA